MQQSAKQSEDWVQNLVPFLSKTSYSNITEIEDVFRFP